MNVTHIFSRRAALSALLVIAMLVAWVFPRVTVHAASITSASDTMSSSKISPATSTHSIKFTSPTGASDNTDTIVITFPSDFNFTGKATTSVTFTHGPSTGLETTETLHGVADGSRWAVATTGTQGRVWTFTAPTDGIGAAAVDPNDVLIFSFTAASSTNPSVATSYGIAISGNGFDSGDITVSIVNDDQVAISATVAQSITFSISDNSISFGTLTSGAARYASGTASGDTSEVEAHNLIVGTNASNGYSLTLNGNTLTSGGNTITAIGASNSASSVGTEQFGLRLTAAGGNGAVNAPYAASGFAFDSGAFPDTVATSTVATANTTYSARYLANIGSNTEAGSYSATLTYTATANY